jgi:putative transcriptional regulator
MIQPMLSQVLEDRGKSLYWLAQETGVAYSTLHKFNKAQTNGIDFRVLDEICAALGCQPGDILIRLPDGAAKPAKKRGTAR